MLIIYSISNKTLSIISHLVLKPTGLDLDIIIRIWQAGVVVALLNSRLVNFKRCENLNIQYCSLWPFYNEYAELITWPRAVSGLLAVLKLWRRS